MNYTIKEIADLACVTTRTLRYYDQIGLLYPAEIGDNGYRYYNQRSLMKLQQILFFRELDVPLNDIQLIISRPDFNLMQALEEHRQSLKVKATRLNKLIETIDNTMEMMKGGSSMTAKDYFTGFDESQYQEEARERWGKTSKYAESQKKWTSYTKEQKEAIKMEGDRLTLRMVNEDPAASPDDPDVQAAIDEYLAYINDYFYTCDVASLRGLADMWVQDLRFGENYEKIRPGGAEFVRDAVHIYSDRNG
jgi:DNA-binding transcriptional MerR regulator